MFRHPNYYKELRKRNTDQAISPTRATAPSRRATGPGPKQQAIEESVPHNDIEEAQASSLKPQASSSLILEPRKSFKHPEPRCSMQIKVFCGCFTWKAIWCGENRILLPFVTFNSIVKKCPELL